MIAINGLHDQDALHTTIKIRFTPQEFVDFLKCLDEHGTCLYDIWLQPSDSIISLFEKVGNEKVGNEKVGNEKVGNENRHLEMFRFDCEHTIKVLEMFNYVKHTQYEVQSSMFLSIPGNTDEAYAYVEGLLSDMPNGSDVCFRELDN